MNAALVHARLLIDILSMKMFVWMFGRNGELLDSHLFFFDRYAGLADHHRRQGRIAKADRLATAYDEHQRREHHAREDAVELIGARWFDGCSRKRSGG